ncbi:MAG: NADH-quinone oxidoreductase subunit J [Actinomyces sp.]|uniref:NADH-quinone oxidoreductase subunit J n=1 Tax=Actinomyces sp. TaxID=29317 RepID=UPI0026DD1673|nr:NADH-quinone oxidoreductase subunit J [Actinomyces sp.]MDO4242178.1 NADH-quinone oxidoreductase subunit J [Actinomyces sp.]
MSVLHAPAALTSAGELSGGETILFGVVALVTVGCALGLLTAKRAVNAAVNMITIMICLAILYVASEAPFLGVTQVVVYTGAVMTLVLFVVMMVGLGGDEPVNATGSPANKWLVALLGAGLATVLVCVVVTTAFPQAAGLQAGQGATPQALAEVLFGSHVVVMELTGILLVIAAVGALSLTHRERIRPALSQRRSAQSKMRAYATRGLHPGQKPMPGVYAATNAATAPALDAAGQAVEESVPRVLRARGDALEVAEVSPETGRAQRSGSIAARTEAAVGRSGMATMPGAPAPVVVQPLAQEPQEADAPDKEPADQDQDKQDKEDKQ